MDSKILRKKILADTEQFIQNKFEGEGSGHDWWHIHRVKNLALHLAEIEGGDKFLVEMAALLHDLDDWKINGTEELNQTKLWLNQTGISEDQNRRILSIIGEVSFKGAGVETATSSIEAAVVQDADRLDAIGAVGIARTFAYGGNKGRLLYHPDEKPEMHNSFEAYKKTTAPTINHFYEKLLLLKDRMNTVTAKKMAEERHLFMEKYLDRFFEEWEGKI